jgi:DNA-binding HxlR family transcriptional regulator
MSKQQLQSGKREKRRSTSGAKSPHHALSTRAQEPASLELDRIIHERLRLGILSALAVNTSLTFNDLKKLLNTSDGNLSVHARKLEEAEYISCEKTFEGRMPKTEYRMTAAGRRALERYLDEMEALIRTTRKTQR